MKKSVFLFLSFIISTFVAHAGNMFGPAAFRNGSPLVTGVDGTYQASARAENVTGIFRFSYSGGSQTANTRQNSWIFFVGGQILQGSVEASIDSTSLTGILDSESLGVNKDTNGQVTLPIYFFSGADSASGSFQGKMNLKSPSGAFNGSGQLLPTPPSSNNLTAIYQEIIRVGNSTATGPIRSTNIPYNTAGGTIKPLDFKFRGVRTSIPSSAGAGNSTASN
jgi:hypothetical protein